MTHTSSVPSTAFNFMSFMENGVDPRTGLYTVNISLPKLSEVSGQGPEFALKLSFNPMNNHDSGFGLGWNLALSQYDFSTRIVTVHTGETFKVEGMGDIDHELLMPEKRLDTFHLYEAAAGRSYTLVHREGMVEILDRVPIDGNSIALPSKILSPQGHAITLQYSVFRNTVPMLSKILDMDGRVLLSITRSDSQVMLTLNPDQFGEQRYLMLLESDRVAEISLPTVGDPSQWTFAYAEGDQTRLIGVQSPSGMHESLEYDDDGHPFPDGPQYTPLPRVTRWLRSPGAGQPVLETRYHYPSGNFLGHGLPIRWSDTDLDPLLHYRGSYHYETIEVAYAESQPMIATRRRYNRLHLLVSERVEVTGSDNVYEQEQHYDFLPDLEFRYQPAWHAMPVKSIERWSDPTGSRESVTTRSYTSRGNLRYQREPDGTALTNEWYPIDGEGEDCPRDPYRFERYIKSKTTTPARADVRGAPMRIVRTRYQALPALDSAPLQDFIVPVEETVLERKRVRRRTTRDTEVHRTLLEYANASDNAFMHGRLTARTVVRNGLNTRNTLVYELVRPEGGEPTLRIRETTQGFDHDRLDPTGQQIDSRRTTTRETSLLSGEIVREYDGFYDGSRGSNQIAHQHFRFDPFARPIEATTAPDDPTVRASHRTAYTLFNAALGIKATQTSTSATGVVTRDELDGAGHVIKRYRSHIDPSELSALVLVQTNRYDGLGRHQHQEDFDYRDGQMFVHSTRTFAYDGWNQLCQTTSSDGMISHQRRNPVGNAEHAGPILVEWQEGADGKRSATVETWINAFDKPARIKTTSASGVLMGLEAFRYDGWARTAQERVHHSDGHWHVTRYEYDACNRVVTMVNPDRSRITHTYALHSSETLPTSIQADNRLVGTQRFDGLDRRVERIVGDRRESFEYEPASLVPSHHVRPSGTRLEYGYRLNHTLAPLSIKVADTVAAAFEYDRVTANLESASNPQGTRSRQFNALHQQTEDIWEDASGIRLRTRYQYSAFDRLLLRTDHDQQGLNHDYDLHGRLTGMSQGDVRATFEYDSLGRLVHSTCNTGRVRCAWTYEFDDLDRETQRTEILDNAVTRTLSQTWGFNGLLNTRHHQEGNRSLLHETFRYDRKGRLIASLYSGEHLPGDDRGKPLQAQYYVFDALDNLNLHESHCADGSIELVDYCYENPDPCQVSRIRHHPSRPDGDVHFEYDDDGNLLNDERGQRLVYNDMGQLQRVDTAVPTAYQYEAEQTLISSQTTGQAQVMRLYQDHQVSLLVQDGQTRKLMYHDTTALACIDGEEATLLLCDANANVRREVDSHGVRDIRYNAYGLPAERDMEGHRPGFNSEWREDETGWYLLGKGLRAYNPALMRFHSPDTLSPFEEGGINPYCYCLGNPIRFRDPTGHMASDPRNWSRPYEPGAYDHLRPFGSYGEGFSFGALLGVTVGILVTVAITIATLGKGAPAAVKAGLAAGKGIAGAFKAVAAVIAANASASATTTVMLSANLAVQAANTVATFTQSETLYKATLYAGIALSVVGLGQGVWNMASAGRVAKGAASASRAPRLTFWMKQPGQPLQKGWRATRMIERPVSSQPASSGGRFVQVNSLADPDVVSGHPVPPSARAIAAKTLPSENWPDATHMNPGIRLLIGAVSYG